MFYVYILYSSILQKYYVGSTEDLNKRIIQHNSGRGVFTSKGAPWILIVSLECETRQMAVKKELQIKKRGIKRYLLDNNLI